MLSPTNAFAQDTGAGEGVILDLEALDSLRKEERGQTARETVYTVAYGPGAAEPAPETRDDILRVAEAAKSASARLTIVAYASKAEGESDNDARRLALRRAIALRQILVAAGIDGSYVNLQPMGLRTEGSGSSDEAEIIVQQP